MTNTDWADPEALKIPSAVLDRPTIGDTLGFIGRGLIVLGGCIFGLVIFLVFLGITIASFIPGSGVPFGVGFVTGPLTLVILGAALVLLFD